MKPNATSCMESLPRQLGDFQKEKDLLRDASANTMMIMSRNNFSKKSKINLSALNVPGLKERKTSVSPSPQKAASTARDNSPDKSAFKRNLKVL